MNEIRGYKPPTPGSKRVSVSLTPEEFDRLEKFAKKRGWSNSNAAANLIVAELDSQELDETINKRFRDREEQ